MKWEKSQNKAVSYPNPAAGLAARPDAFFKNQKAL